jgi:ABC-type multidrug transport system fused ATPase/permease subunit
VIIAAAAIIAVNSKFNLEVEDIAVIGTAISFSLRLTGIVTSFIRDAVGLELAMKGSSKKNFDIIDKNPVTDQTLPKKPAGWPQDNSIQFDKVSISYAGYDEPTVKEVSFTINSG